MNINDTNILYNFGDLLQKTRDVLEHLRHRIQQPQIHSRHMIWSLTQAKILFLLLCVNDQRNDYERYLELNDTGSPQSRLGSRGAF